MVFEIHVRKVSRFKWERVRIQGENSYQQENENKIEPFEHENLTLFPSGSAKSSSMAM